MDSSSEEVGPTEGTVLALLDFLVDPLLPSKFVSKEPPQEDLVAKQMHAVVLLYNYYHRKHNPALEFLDSVSFSKLALRLKPSLLSYLKLMQRTDYAELEDLEQYMSLTEKEIMNACDISKSLDASNSEPVIEGWPITKVAVFLVDFKKENCFLFHSSVTRGVWSVIEKDLPGEEAASEARHNKKRIIKKTPKENQHPDEAALQRVACSAIKEACALNQGDLRILETHTVYSITKANAAVRLYIMQCTLSKQDENLVPISDAMDSLQGPLVTQESGSWMLTSVVEYFHLLPFADKVVNWLSSDSKMHENVAQDFQAVKENGCYPGFCFNVEEVPPCSDHSEAEKKLDNHSNSHLNQKLLLDNSEPLGTSKDDKNGNSCQPKVEVLKHTSKLPDALKEVQNGSSCQAKEEILSVASALAGTAKDVLSGSTGHLNKEPFQLSSDRPEKEVENIFTYRRKNEATELVVYKKRNKSQKINSGKFLGGQTSNASAEHTRHEEDCAVSGSSSNMDVYEPYRTCLPVGETCGFFSCGDHGDDQKHMIVAQEPLQSTVNGGAIVLAEVCDTNSQDHYVEKQNHAVLSSSSNLEYLQKVEQIISSKEALLSQTALNVLYRKRELLSQQLPSIADEIALCDRKIEIILKGGDDDLAVKLDSIVEGCNDLCRKSGGAEDTAHLIFRNPDIPPVMKRKRISEANLCILNASQELDTVCNENS